ncbi:hypothetical protein CY34DRAFT_40113, partial [Suillus luteus UH-Slu-Lm8-n1]
YVSLEKQLAIFLYSCMIGLTIQHVGEQFQRSNDTISCYFHKMLVIFLSNLFYQKYITFPT